MVDKYLSIKVVQVHALNSNVRIIMTVAPSFFLVAVVLGILIFSALLVVGGLTNILTNKYRPEFAIERPLQSALLSLSIAALINMNWPDTGTSSRHN